MPNPTLLLKFEQAISGVTGTVTDITTTYGGSNPLRTVLGNYLLWSKTDSQGTRVYDNPPNAAVLSDLTYTVNTPEDGWFQATLLSLAQYNAGTPYVPRLVDGQGVVTQYEDVIYYAATNKFYKCILGVTGTAPDAGSGSTYWAEVTDKSILLPNTKVNKVTLDVLITYNTDKCIKDQFYKKIDGCGCKLTCKDMEPAMRSYFLSIGALSKFNDAAPEAAETIINVLEENCGIC